VSAQYSDRYVVGVDFGTLTARALVVRVSDGFEVGTGVHAYRHGVIDQRLPISGEELPPDWALQDPEDYLESLGVAVRLAVSSSRVDPAAVIAIATDFTACTMVPTLDDGTPLCQLPEFKDRPHAYVKLWRHHAAQPQADRINRIATARNEPWLSRYGGFISSEWEFAKGLELLENDGQVYRAMERWVEAADWIVWQLCGRYVRNACTAGYKGIRQDGVYPSRDYLVELNPAFGDFVTEKLEQPIGMLGDAAGTLTADAAARIGLPEGIVVAVGNVDAHVTVPAARAVEPGRLVAIMGTSTCHVVNGESVHDVPGMCGVVDGGIVAGSWGYEAGQSGVGDLFAWCANYGVPIEYQQAATSAGIDLHEYISKLASAQEVGQHGLLALDWHNGNRSVLVNHELSGLVLGFTVNTRPEDVYRALVEATAFGARTIVDTLVDHGVSVDQYIVAGGLAKNPFVMQIYADILRRQVSVVASEPEPALGSAIHAAVAVGAYPDVARASGAMGSSCAAVYRPTTADADLYEQLFAEYTQLHDHFGRGGTDVMHRLKRLQREAVS
jgi:L-ribulokinase